MKQKSKISVMEAAIKAFQKMPDEFHGYQFCDRVRIIVGRVDLMDQTCMRKLRLIRHRGCPNVCIDSEKSLYRKV